MQRRLALEGTLNFRDLGGYPTADGQRVRWRRLFRSDALHLLTAADVAHLRDEIGLGCIVDLRSTAELRAEGRGPLAEHDVRFHHLPLFDGARGGERPALESLGDLYFMMLEFAREPIARVITTLAEAETPAVFHCAAGKDRTGVVSALLLGLLDVRDEVIVADYAATQETLDAIVDRLLALEGYQEMLRELPPDTMHADPATMVRLLERLREQYGSAAGYAREAGVPAEMVARLRETMLER